jgi:hypothetical protein
MKRQDLLSILITFSMGAILGFYVYLAGFAPTTERVSTAIEEASDSLVITGEAYGGCQRVDNCPTFNIADDGSYRYFYTPLGTDEPVMREGVLPLALQQQLDRHVVQPPLEDQSRSIEPVFCESFVDGIDVQYDVSLNDVDFTLDSCGTDVVAESPLWQALSNIWTYFERSA